MCHITVKEDFKILSSRNKKYTTVIDVDKIYSKVTDSIDYKPAICLNKQLIDFLVLFAWWTENCKFTLTEMTEY